MFLLLWIFYFAAGVQLLYWGLFFMRFAFFKAKPAPALPEAPVSIIICARNEAANLRKNLRKVLEQDYPLFEVLLVDDASTDETAEVVAAFQQEFQQLRYQRIEQKLGPGKKAALLLGWQQASHEWLLLTDADGQPASRQWVRQMMAARQHPNCQIVLGYGPYVSYSQWLNKWIRYETHYSAMQYFSAALWGTPYMGVGRNLLYHSSLLAAYRQTVELHGDIASGDDDLFINKAAHSGNTNICISPKTFVYSEPKRSIKALFKQKRRHYSTGTRYKAIHKVLLGGLSLSHSLFWMVGCIGVFFFPLPILLFFCVRCLLLLIIWIKVLSKFQDIKLFTYIVLLDVMTPLYYVLFAPSLLINKPKHWK